MGEEEEHAPAASGDYPAAAVVASSSSSSADASIGTTEDDDAPPGTSDNTQVAAVAISSALACLSPRSTAESEFASATSSPAGFDNDDDESELLAVRSCCDANVEDSVAARAVRELMLGGDVGVGVGEEEEAMQATPEADIRRRLVYGIAEPGVFSPEDVIDHLDSPGAHGCRQM